MLIHQDIRVLNYNAMAKKKKFNNVMKNKGPTTDCVQKATLADVTSSRLSRPILN